jgi:branched-chain amino acid transport system ATP-binding protein
LLALVGLDPDAVGRRPAGTLSYGDQRRVEVARALASQPRLLLLDEPGAGMNRVEKDRLRALLEELVATRGLTLVLIEHDVRLVMQLCQRLAVLNFGAKIAEGTPAEVAEDPAVVAAYLGTRVAQAVEAGETLEGAVEEAVDDAAAESIPVRNRAGPERGAVLTVEDLEVAYGAIRAVRGVSFEVGEGELVALIGANGAGKSSILRALSGIVPARGRAQFGRLDLLSARSPRIVRAGLVQVPEGREILARLSVHENLELGAWGRRDQRGVARDIEEQYERFPVLGARRSLPAGQLSGGEQQILAIARALVARPKLLLLDEPSLGLAPMLAEEVFAIVKAVNAEGISVLLVEQNAYHALELAERAWVIETGQVAIAGAATELLHDERVRASYLGLD